MKFGVKLREYAVPEWSDKYINYNELKRVLQTRQMEINRAMDQLTHSDDDIPSSSANYDYQTMLIPLQMTYTRAEMLTTSWQDFKDLLERELRKVEDHYQSETLFLEDRLDGICKELDQVEGALEHGQKTHSEAHSHKTRIRRAVIGLYDCFDRLDGYVNLNKLATWKILKKRDKLWNIDQKEMDYSAISQRLEPLRKNMRNEETMLQLWAMCSDDKSRNLDVNTLRAAVQRHAAMRPQEGNRTWLIAFLGGVCSVLVLDVLMLIFVRPTNPSYSSAAFINTMPIYRMCFAVVLLTWGFGLNLYVFEIFGVNYKFLLDFNPSSDVQARNVLSVAAELTVLWTLNFALFFIDYRYYWIVNENWYWVYPFSLLVTTGSFFHYFTDKELRKGMIQSLKRTLRDACNMNRDITLLGNMIGDILTSMVKPLADMEYTLCYYSYGLWHEEMAVCQGDKIATTIITLIPFLIRCLQCLNRIKNSEPEHRSRHWANLGKYISGITVILFTSFDPPATNHVHSSSTYLRMLGFIILYLIASQYSLYWDMVYDWGLLPDSENLLRPHDSSMYPQWMYHAAGTFNLVARLTWAVTLMPVNTISDRPQFAALLTFIVSGIEIVRRCIWMLLRLENEHITNSSHYRGMLWVPPPLPDTLRESKSELGEDMAAWRISYRQSKASGKLRISQKHGTAVYLKGPPSNGVRRSGSSSLLTRVFKPASIEVEEEVNEVYTCPEIVKVHPPRVCSSDVFMNWIDHG